MKPIFQRHFQELCEVGLPFKTISNWLLFPKYSIAVDWNKPVLSLPQPTASSPASQGPVERHSICGTTTRPWASACPSLMEDAEGMQTGSIRWMTAAASATTRDSRNWKGPHVQILQFKQRVWVSWDIFPGWIPYFFRQIFLFFRDPYS